jgi:elongation factor Ts
MAEISAALVKELRDRTGAGMMDCKRALQETNGDLDAAERLLREKGIASAGKRTGRTTSEGKVGYRVADDRGRGTIVAVGCETDFVASNDDFLAFAKQVLEAVEREGPGGESALEEQRLELSAKLKENIVVVGAARFEAVNGAAIDGYAHPPANKLGVLVHVRGGSAELPRRLAMHIAASAPDWVGREDVPEDLATSEREIFEQSDEVKSKPEQVREKIVDGMLRKQFYAARVLTEQPWIHDPGQSVGQVLAAEGAEVLEFERLQLG